MDSINDPSSTLGPVWGGGKNDEAVKSRAYHARSIASYLKSRGAGRASRPASWAKFSAKLLMAGRA